MFELIRRQHDPAIRLPFLPRSSGINRFRHAGEEKEMPGIDAVEICTVSRGVCQIEQRGKMVTLSPGESLYKLPGEHRKKIVLSESGAEVYWATFEGPEAENFMLSYDLPVGPLPTGSCPVELYEGIARCLITGSDDALRRATALYAALIVRLVSPEPQTESLLLPECLRLIRTNFPDPSFNIDALAAAVDMHRTTLSRLFRKELNTTPWAYLQCCRIDHALELLRTTGLPVAEIASSSGFQRSNYFCKVIRIHCGKTPEEYRRQA